MVDEKTTPVKCLILGGSGYVGAAVCRLLYNEGANIVFTYFSNSETAHQLVEELPGAKMIHTDLSNYLAASRTVSTAAEMLGGLDVLVQCAGTAGDATLYTDPTYTSRDKFLKINEAEFDQMINLTVKSTFAACQQAAIIMSKQKSGEII
ncbi:MAG: SDR family NAD(P)-dependent oxidoreductase, partial [Acidobacteriota bacterium]